MADDARIRLDELRQRIHDLDAELVGLVAERRALVVEIGALKETLGLPVLDPPQEARVVRRAAELARASTTDEELIRDILWRIIASARAEQEGQTHWGPPPDPKS
jgi:chorismate mutase